METLHKAGVLKPRFQSTLNELYRSSEYMSRHLPLSADYFAMFTKILVPELPDAQLDFLREGALYHDIGKRAAKDILEKPVFTQQERELMHWHPAIGESFLKQFYGKHHPYTFIAGAHHERYDGTGYPCGASGESIPFYARVMTIADIYSTITQKRPYEAHVFTHAEALELLEQEAGKIFDPEMIRIIVPVLAKQNGS